MVSALWRDKSHLEDNRLALTDAESLEGEMTREEQLDGLLREALLKASNLYNDVERARRQNYAASPVLQFENWLRAEFIRTQAP